MTALRNPRILIGALSAAAVAVVTYLLGEGVITAEIATIANALIAGAAGYFVPKG